MFGRKEPPISEEHYRKWTKIRARGENYYVLTRGILFAILVDVFGTVVTAVWQGHMPRDFRGLFNLDSVVGSIFIGVVAGAIAGSQEWRLNEKRYQRELAQFSSSQYESPEQTLKQLQRGIENVR
jgi:hypothetical protein